MPRKIENSTLDILQRARRRREGGKPWEVEEDERVEQIVEQPDVLLDAIRAGDVTRDDIPISEKKHDVLQTATETAWSNAGPTDLDAMRCREQGHHFVTPKEARLQEKGVVNDPAYTDFESGLRAAARQEYQSALSGLLARGVPRKDAESMAAQQVRVAHAERLPGDRHGPTQDLKPGVPVPPLMGEAVSDSRIQKGFPVNREIPEGPELETAPATFVRDLTPERVKALEGGVTRTAPAPQ